MAKSEKQNGGGSTTAKPAAKDELPPSPIVQPPPDEDTLRADPERKADDALYRAYMHAEAIVKDLNELLLGEKGVLFRQAAAELRTPVGGDGRQWPPLNAILRVLLSLDPLG